MYTSADMHGTIGRHHMTVKYKHWAGLDQLIQHKDKGCFVSSLLFSLYLRATLSAYDGIVLPSAFNSASWYSVESRQVNLTFKNSPERNSPGLLI